MDPPKVTVLMSVYNGEKYLKEAIESILNQTFRDFEFIIINDGSTDSTSAILTRYQQKDARIRIYSQENQGLVASLNRGCQLARGEYIARMDADDISLPERLAKQVAYMEANTEVGVLGTWMECINAKGIPHRKVRTPTTPSLIRWYLLFGCCMVHSSILMRRDVIEQVGFYRSEALHVEDYDLWTRASLITELANLPEIQLRYRVCEDSISSQHAQTQTENAIKIMHSAITGLLGVEIPMRTVSSLGKGLIGLPLDEPQQVDQVALLILRLYRAYLNTYSLGRAEIREVARVAGEKLLTLAASTGKISLVRRLCIVAQAIRLSPRLLWSKQVIAKGSQRGFGILLGRV